LKRATDQGEILLQMRSGIAIIATHEFIDQRPLVALWIPQQMPNQPSTHLGKIAHSSSETVTLLKDAFDMMCGKEA